MITLNNKVARGLAGITLAGMIGITGVAQATSSATDARSNGVWTVESGQWLGRIVAALESNPAKRARLMEEIVFLNPRAFVNSDPNRMRAGADLKLPGASELARSATPSTSPARESATEIVTMAERIGRITALRGKLTATGKNGASRALRRRSYVRQGDTLSTGKNGGAQVKFNDGAQIALRRDSSLKIDEYNWQGEEDGSEKAVMSLVKGGFRTITGAIGKANKTNYKVSTPFATIGIRGTHYALFIDAALEALIGGTAFGEIVVNDDLSIGPQQYFQADASGVQALMGPPPNLFGGDTQVGDEPEEGDVASNDGGEGEDGDGADGFSTDGGTESGGLIAGLQSDLPGQEDDNLFTEGELTAADESVNGGAFDLNNLDLTGDLSGLGTFLVSFFEQQGALNVQLRNGPNDVAYGVYVDQGLLFEALDTVIDNSEDGAFFVTGEFGVAGFDALLGALGIDFDGGGLDDINLFLGPPGGTLLAHKAVMQPGFSAYLGRWNAGVVNLFFETAFEGDPAEQGFDTAFATEFVHSSDRIPDAQLLNLAIGMNVNFSSLHGFGSDETGQGFTIGAGNIQFDVNFMTNRITNAFVGISDGQGRSWQFSGSPGSLNIALENDAGIPLNGFGGRSAFCSGCIGSSAEGELNVSFLGANAEGALGSLVAHQGSLDNDVLEAIAAVFVGAR